MAKGNRIVLSPDPQGIKLEGTLTTACKPGQVMEVDPLVLSMTNGRPNYRIYQSGTDGKRAMMVVANVNMFTGGLATDAYAAGDHGYFYVPQAGEEMNMLLGDITGTGDPHTYRDILIVQSSTGKLITTTGSPTSEPFILLETLAALTTDTLAWCFYTGY